MANDYWGDRMLDRLTLSERKAVGTLININGAYDTALANIDREIKSLYSNFAVKGILPARELKKALTPGEQKKFIDSIRDASKKLRINPAKIYDERYLGRLNRLEALNEQIKLEVMAIAPREERVSDLLYSSIIRDNYTLTQSDLASVGVAPSFATIDRRIANVIMNSVWQGSNYSARIWNNTGALAVQLPTIIGGALLSGTSYQKTSRLIVDRFNVKKYEATRLVRSETNYFHNQSELQSYIDDGISRYEFDAFLDAVTSDICRDLDGNIYLVKEAVVGLNYPPMLPNCRSIPRVLFEGERIQPAQTVQDRTERFEGQYDGSIAERYRQAMQAQMNPNKATRDYNADMNILTQTYKGEELQNKITELMKTIPADYPLRDALAHVAQLYGWIPTKVVAIGFLGKSTGKKVTVKDVRNSGFLGKAIR